LFDIRKASSSGGVWEVTGIQTRYESSESGKFATEIRLDVETAAAHGMN